jgi:hypothetical protein
VASQLVLTRRMEGTACVPHCFFRHETGRGLDHPRCFTTVNVSLGIIRYGEFYGSQRWIIETWGGTAHPKDIGQYLGLG